MPLTDDDKQEIAGLFAAAIAGEDFAKAVTTIAGKAISGGVADHLKRAGVTKEALGGFTSKLAELEGKLTTGGAQGAGGEGGNQGAQGGAAGQQQKPTQDSVELATMRKALADLQKKADDAERREKAAIAKNREADLRTRAAEALAAKGFKEPARANLALAALIDAGKRIAYENDESDRIVYREADGSVVELDAGLSGWVKTEEAKLLMPPTGARGSGSDPRGGRPPPIGGKPDQAEIKARLGQALKDALDRQ